MAEKSILIVEDEPQIRLLMRHLLQHDGWQIYEAASAAIALRVLNLLPEKPKVVLTDVKLEEDDSGVVLAAEIELRCPLTQIVLCSGSFSSDGASPADYRYIQKPFHRDGFLEVLNGLLAEQDRNVFRDKAE